MNETLARAGVARRILSEPNKEKPSNVRRIPYLAGMRNRLLEPLESDSFDYVLFLNDVVFVAEDAITLLASRGMDYDAVCGLDFYWSVRDFLPRRALLFWRLSRWHAQFYDFFATRMTSGLALGSGYYPYTEMTEEQALVRNDQPFPVFSCWNGMAAFRADPFTRVRMAPLFTLLRVTHSSAQDKVRFRALKPELATVEYEASECCLVHADLRASGHTRIFINPMVKVAYHWRFYFLHNSVLPWFNGLFLLFNRPDGHAYLRAVARNGDGSRTDEYLSDSPLEAMCVQ